MKRFQALASVAGAVAIATWARADVLHDTLFIAENNPSDALANNIGGYLVWGRRIDAQVCDDFAVPAGGSYIDTVTGDYISYLYEDPSDGVLLEFFADVGGYPAETPTWARQASGDEVAIEIFDYPWGGPRFRITVTLPHEDLLLPGGNWFVAITPIDGADVTGGYFQFRENAVYYGLETFVRNSGQDHLDQGWWFGGYDGVAWPGNDWVALSQAGFGHPLGESAFRVTGHPAASCDADFNDDGVIDTRDVLDFLNAWASGDPGADIDGNGVIDTRDVLAYLNLWNGGC